MANVEFSFPFQQAEAWLDEAKESEINDPTAMTLATVDETGMPSARMVLLKGIDEKGLVFYTNLGSRKGRQLAGNGKAALLFHWKSLRRQIRVEGHVQHVSDEEADAYFASRPKASQIGAWASRQSHPMEGRFEFEAAIAKYTAKFGAGKVPRPDFWTGFRLTPIYFEFWRDRKYRLHERKIYSLTETGAWSTAEIYP